MTSSPYPLQGDVDLRELVRVAWGSRFFLLLLVLIVAGIAGCWALKIPERYLVETFLKIERSAHADYTKEEMYAVFESDVVLAPVAEKYRIGLDVLRGNLQIDRKKKPVLKKNGSFSWIPYFLVVFESDRKDSAELSSAVISLFKKAFERHVQVLAMDLPSENRKPPGDWVTVLETTTQVKKVNVWKILTCWTFAALVLGLMSVFGFHFFRGSLQQKI